jgi:hypothetical protein
MTATPQTAEPKSASPHPATPAGRADETAWLHRNWWNARRVRHCDLSYPGNLLCCGATLFTPALHRSSATAGTTGRSGRGTAEYMNAGREILHASIVQEDPTVLKLNRLPNSIDTLSPNDPFVKEMNALPMAKRIPYHSIIGDRGRGDTPNSSDGVVPYWSSHLDGAESEKIVPSGHGAEHSPPRDCRGPENPSRTYRKQGAQESKPRPGLRRTEIPAQDMTADHRLSCCRLRRPLSARRRRS